MFEPMNWKYSRLLCKCLRLLSHNEREREAVVQRCNRRQDEDKRANRHMYSHIYVFIYISTRDIETT